MTSRLPFTLTPLDGEPFDIWLYAYAARLAMIPAHLAEALGMPARWDHGPGAAVIAGRPAAQLAAICAATGLAAPAVTAMFAAGSSPPRPLVLAWTPGSTTRFCPACLAEAPGQMPAAWSLPVTFFCLRHGQLLADCCPHCGRRPASHARPAQTGCCGGCGGRLDTASPRRFDHIRAARRAQKAISGFLARFRDPAGTAASRRCALSQLTDITLIACHLAAESDSRRRPGQAFTPDMLGAGVLTTAFTLLTAHPDSSGHDPLASLVTAIPPGTVPPAIPHSWRPASTALGTRITRARDPWLRPADRLRHATTLPVPRTPVPRLPGAPDPAAARAARLPDQLWPDWAVRLTDDATSSSHDKFLPAALIALLLPHSAMPLKEVTTMVSGQLRRHVTGYHMGKLTAGTDALRILTELAFAIDDHDIPIDYQRRRDLAASTTLIGDDAWARMTREAGMRLAPAAHARRYLYELLTGCGLGTAPPPYRLTGAESHGSYSDFVLGMPASLATALTDHARHLLAGWGIGDEPLQWQPPDDWVTAATWPGADPARTDPAPIHHALLNGDTPPIQIAASLGISPGHLRQVLRRHPLPRPRRPVRHTLIPTPEPSARPPAQQTGVLYLDLAWLREEYLTWHRSLDDIAGQLDCPVHTLNRFAHDHGIPVRTRGTSIYIPASAAPGLHPRDLPEPLHRALIGGRARRRLDHLLAIAGHASILQAARALGIWQSTLYQQVARLERACGGPLVHRGPRSAGTGILTPLGQQLCQQAREYLGLQTDP
jgi:Bacterial regulatory helix-turn-helix protein, lysR family/TniQ